MSLAPTLTERDREAAHARSQSQYSALFGELFSALVQCDPGRLVRAPGSEGGRQPAFDLVYDEMAGRDADDMRSRITYLIGAAAVQTCDPALQQMALRLCNDLAHGFASYREGL